MVLFYPTVAHPAQIGIRRNVFSIGAALSQIPESRIDARHNLRELGRTSETMVAIYTR